MVCVDVNASLGLVVSGSQGTFPSNKLIVEEEEEEERLYLLRIARDSAQTLINLWSSKEEVPSPE